MGGAVAMQGVVQGNVFPSSGLTSLPDGRFVSCSRNKSVLQFSSAHQPGKCVVCNAYPMSDLSVRPHTHTRARTHTHTHTHTTEQKNIQVVF